MEWTAAATDGRPAHFISSTPLFFSLRMGRKVVSWLKWKGNGPKEMYWMEWKHFRGEQPAQLLFQQSNFFAHSRRQRNGVERKSCAIHEINCFSFLFAGGYGRWHRQWLRQEEKTKEKQLMNEWSRSKERLVKSNNSTWMAVSMKLMKLIEWWWNELNWFDWTEGRGALAGRPRPLP